MSIPSKYEAMLYFNTVSIPTVDANPRTMKALNVETRGG